MEIKLKSGNNASIAMKLSEPLDGNKLKIGIYNPQGHELFATQTGDGLIQVVDETHYILELTNEVTQRFGGLTMLRAVVYSNDKRFVNSAVKPMVLWWEKEPASQNLK